MRPKPPKKTQTELNAAFWNLPDDALVDRVMAGAVAHLGKKSMELLAMKGGGPPYSVNGKALYRKGDVVEWLRKRSRTIEVTAQREHQAGKNLKKATKDESGKQMAREAINQLMAEGKLTKETESVEPVLLIGERIKLNILKRRMLLAAEMLVDYTEIKEEGGGGAG